MTGVALRAGAHATCLGAGVTRALHAEKSKHSEKEESNQKEQLRSWLKLVQQQLSDGGMRTTRSTVPKVQQPYSAFRP